MIRFQLSQILRTPDNTFEPHFLATRFPGGMIDQVAANLTKYFPEPNQAGTPGTDLNNFFFSGSNQQNVNNYSGRGDYQLSAKTTLMGRYSLENLSPWVVPATFGKSNIASPGFVTKPQHHPYVIAKVIQSFTPSFFGEFHGSWTRWFYSRKACRMALILRSWVFRATSRRTASH